jgi:hypothetical protein
MNARLLYLMGTAMLLLLPPALADVIHYWRFEEGAGGSTADQVGGMDGTLEGGGGSIVFPWSSEVPAATVALTGEANNRSFYASSGYFIDITTPQAMTLGTSFTIEYFYYAEEIVVASPMFGLGGGDRLYMVMGGSPGNLLFRPQFEGNLILLSADLAQLNVWQHFALVRDDDTYRIYIDGALEHEDVLPPDAQGSYVFPGTVETGTRTIGNGFRGYLDEFRISDTALTPTQFLNAVPEPGTLGLLALGGLALLARRTSHRWKS